MFFCIYQFFVFKPKKKKTITFIWFVIRKVDDRKSQWCCFLDLLPWRRWQDNCWPPETQLLTRKFKSLKFLQKISLFKNPKIGRKKTRMKIKWKLLTFTDFKGRCFYLYVHVEQLPLQNNEKKHENLFVLIYLSLYKWS